MLQHNEEANNFQEKSSWDFLLLLGNVYMLHKSKGFGTKGRDVIIKWAGSKKRVSR
jgi:hypothetical protein